MIRVNVSLANASVTETETLTAGRVGLECGFTFSSEWDDLLKVAVFEGEQTIEVALGKATVAVIPPECMATAGYNLRIGVYGLSPANAIVIPTVWAKAGKIKDSAGPDEDSFAPATPELVAQIMSASETALSIAQGVAADAEAGEFDGVSPTVAVTETTGGHTVTITDRDGNHNFDVMDGASAYAQAVEGGYTESEQQFNTDLARFKTYAAEAESSANAAAASENNAGDSATAAASSATAALNAKTAAEQARTAAAQSASNAATAASTASTKAGEAAQSATSARDSAATATQKASESSVSATAAAGSATSAGSAASAAAASATAAGNAQTAAETAQGNAEDAQEAAETAQDAAEAAAASIAESAAQIAQNTEDVADLKSAFESFESQVFEESSPNFIRLSDIPETVEAGLTYSLTDNYLDVSGTTTEAFTKYLPLLQPIPAGSYYFTNFMTFATGIINGTFNLITTDNQFILLSGQNVTNLAVTIPEGKTVDRLSIYFGANRLETSTYRFCLTDYQLPTPAVYPEDTIELAPTITNLLDEKYDTDAVTPNRAVCWGDSLTDGAPTYSYPSILQSLITAGGNTITVENGGQGGETSLQIAVRQGSIALEVNPATIPASGDVTITIANWNGKNIEILTRGGAYVTYNNPHLLLNPVSINGVAGNVLRNSSGDIIFTRAGSGAESQFMRPVIMSVIADADYNLPTDVTIIWSGTNDTLWDIDQTITTIQNMIATLKNEKYIIVGLTAKVHFSNIVDRNFAMANAFGKHFLNVRDYILAYGLADAEITPTAQDETDIANGEIPSSLRVDSLHFNEAGYTIVATQVYKKGQELGYWV